MENKTLLHGAASEIITPFTDDGKVDYDLLAAECEFMIQNGITAFFVNGLASEAMMLGLEQRV